MSDVINLDDRRPPDYDGLRCTCGEAWFVLVGQIGVATHGAVTLTREGTVSSFHGEPVCITCGQAVTLPREQP